jgi:hypothetical protein
MYKATYIWLYGATLKARLRKNLLLNQPKVMKRTWIIIQLLLVIQLSVGYSQGVIFSEGFETGEIPLNWKQEFISGSVNWRYEDGGYTTTPLIPNSRKPVSAHGGDYNAIFQFQNLNNEATKLVTCQIRALEFAIKPELHFWHAQYEWKHADDLFLNDELRVYYKTSLTSPWNLLQEYTQKTTNWVERIILLPENDLSATYYLAFEGKTKWGWGTCVDDIQIIETGVLQKYLSDLQVAQASTIPVSTGSENNPMLRLDLKVMGNSGSCPLDSLTVTSLNTSDADLKANGVKLYITEAPEFNANTQIGEGINFIAGKARFKNLNYDLPPGYSYLWITYDVNSLAEHKDILDAKFTANSIRINNQLFFTGEESPEGSRTVLRTLYFDDFETDRGWILSGEFEYGTPLGLGGFQGNPDPSGAYSGTKCIGTDLTGLGEFPGDYEENLSDKEYLAISDTFDFTYYNDISIRYMRWLNIGNDDYASIDVSSDGGKTWHEAWSNGSLILDGNWTLHEVDISEFAARKNKVLIRFSLGPTNDYWQFSGWNIDDFSITGKFVSNDVGIHRVISPLEGCGHTNSDSVTIIVKNYGFDDSDGIIPLQYSFHGHEQIVLDTLYQVIPFGDSVLFTFKKKADLTIPDIYSFSVSTDMQDDEDVLNNMIEKAFYVQPTLENEHTENFESKGGLWMAKPRSTSSWECGFPGYGIDPPSGTKLWMTRLLSNYPDNDSSFVESVCYKNDDQARKILRMKYWVVAESDKDGAAVQYSTDNGLSWQLLDTLIAGYEWYNDTIQSLNSRGWSGNSEGWIAAGQILPKSITDAPSMKFRLAFTSDMENNDIGFAFDDFSISAAPFDIGVSQIDTYEDACQYVNPNQLTVTIKNYGINTLRQNDTIIVGFDLNQSHMATDTFRLSADIMPGQTIKHTFAEPIDVTSPDNYNLTAYTLIEDDPWFYFGNNDTTSLDFVVYPAPVTSLLDTIQTHLPDTVVLETIYMANYDYWWNGVSGVNTFSVKDAGWQHLKVTATRGNGCTSYDSTNVELLFHDVGSSELVHPVNACGFGEHEYLVVRIKNFGTDSLSAGQKVAVVYCMNAEAPVSDTLVLANTILSGKTIDFTFTKGAIDLSQKGTFNFKVYTSYSGDTIAANDTITRSIEILGRPAVSLGPDITVEALSRTLDAGSGYVSYNWDNGATTQTREVTETGSYWVQVFDENQCDNYDTAYVRLKIRDISPDGFVSPVSDCRFDPAEPVSLRIINAGTDTVPVGTAVAVSYSFQGGNRISETVNLTTALLPGAILIHDFPGTVDMNNPADYSLEATAVITGDLRTTNDTSKVTIYRYAKPVVDFELQSTVFIEEISLPIEAGYSPYYSYQWQDGFAGHLYTATADGLYHVIATDTRTSCFDRDSVRVYLIYGDVGVTWSDMPQNGCTGEFENIQVRIQNLGPSNIGKDAPIYIACDVNGTRVTVDTLIRSSNFGSGASLDLVLSGKIPINHVGASQVAFYSLYSEDKKRENDTLVLAFDGLTGPVIDFGDVNGVLNTDLPHELDAGAGHKSYLWQDNSVGQTYTVIQQGIYSVTVTGQNDCQATKTVSINMTDGVEGIVGETGDIILYPNPNSGVFHILLKDQNAGDLMVRIINNQGQIVYISQNNATELANEQIDLQQLPRGIYHVLIQTDKLTYQGTIIIQ